MYKYTNTHIYILPTTYIYMYIYIYIYTDMYGDVWGWKTHIKNQQTEICLYIDTVWGCNPCINKQTNIFTSSFKPEIGLSLNVFPSYLQGRQGTNESWSRLDSAQKSVTNTCRLFDDANWAKHILLAPEIGQNNATGPGDIRDFKWFVLAFERNSVWKK